MGLIHWTPLLAHVVLLSVISSSHSSVRLSTLTIYQYIQYLVSTNHGQIVILVFVLVQLYFILTLSYMLSTFQVLTHTCATSSRDIGLGSQHSYHA